MKQFIATNLLLFFGLYAYSQCFEDRHNSTKENAWVSCTANLSPDDNDPTSRHWIMYDLGDSYQLHELTIWNVNHIDELTSGVQDLKISISQDGQDFTEATTVSIPMASGSSTYEGHQAYDFTGSSTRYLLFTALSNYGGTCTGFAEMRVMLNPSGSVPVELLSFEVESQATDAIIDWASATEINVDYYELQRSFDQQEWAGIYQEEISIDSYATQKYRHSDRGIAHYLEPKEYVYYRLKMVDNDGSIAYSDVRSISFEEIEPFQDLLISPNPLVDNTSLNLEYLAFSNSTEQLLISDINGALVFKKTLTNKEGYNSLSINLSSVLSKGVYIVKIGEKLNGKLVVQ